MTDKPARPSRPYPEHPITNPDPRAPESESLLFIQEVPMRRNNTRVVQKPVYASIWLTADGQFTHAVSEGVECPVVTQALSAERLVNTADTAEQYAAHKRAARKAK